MMVHAYVTHPQFGRGSSFVGPPGSFAQRHPRGTEPRGTAGNRSLCKASQWTTTLALLREMEQAEVCRVAFAFVLQDDCCCVVHRKNRPRRTVYRASGRLEGINTGMATALACCVSSCQIPKHRRLAFV